MVRSLGAAAYAVVRPRMVLAGLVGGVLMLGALACARSSTAAPTCNASATPSTFASAVSAASAGQTICLASGNYGTWSGTSKAITLTPASGASPTMHVSFGSGDSGFTIDGLGGLGGTIDSGARDITIKNSTFTTTLDIEGATSNVVIDGNAFDWNATYNGGANAKIFLDTSGTLSAPAVVISDNSISNGELDGIHVGGGSGMQIVGNSFRNLCDVGNNHTDNLQFEGGSQIRIAGNYMYAAESCATQGLTSYDGGTNGVIVEDNVVDIPRDWGIEFYADKNSIIRHNTVVYHDKSYSEFNTGTGHIDINRKSSDPAGSGTQVYDNLANGVSFANGSTGTQHNNVNDQTAKYVGPTTSWPGFKLASDSPVGLDAASDGTDAGARIGTGATPAPTPSPSPTPTPSPSPTPTPTPSPSPTPTPSPAQVEAIWTAPTGVVVGSPVTLDGTQSSGQGTLACTWSFENSDGSIVWETQTGCKLQKTFQTADTKYVRLIVKDATGATASNKQSFLVTAATDTSPKAIWTAPSGATVGTAVVLDGTRSTGDAPLSCKWSFEDAGGSTVYETATGCKLSKAFKVAGTKYVRLVVTDSDGDTSSNKQSFTVSG